MTHIEPGEQALSSSEQTKRRVFITGAAGGIGADFAEHMHKIYDLRLMARATDRNFQKIKQFGEVVVGDITDMAGMKAVCQGVDTVIHLAANAWPGAEWDDLLPNNIVGTYNVFTAAKEAGCRRVIYASSVHAVLGHPGDMQIKTDDPPNPMNLYGVSKCFGECLGRYMGEQQNLSTIAIRIGWCVPVEEARTQEHLMMMEGFISYRDMRQLLHKCIEVENVRFAIVHGISENPFKKLDISDTRTLLGYAPEDNFAAENPKLKDLRLGRRLHPLRKTPLPSAPKGE
jgi:hypothetical protein